MPTLILVSGAPATGKTTIAAAISRELGIACIHKDVIKESLLDSLGTRDREWSKQVGAASIRLMFKLIEDQLAVGSSVLAESNFRPEYDRPRLERFEARYSPAVVEVHCSAAPEVVVSRYRRRGEAGERHPGHLHDEVVIEELANGLNTGMWVPISADEHVIPVDTTDFEAVDVVAIAAAVRSRIERGNEHADH